MADELEAGTEGEALASPTLRRCIVTPGAGAGDDPPIDPEAGDA
jgi:hypothetical protein